MAVKLTALVLISAIGFFSIQGCGGETQEGPDPNDVDLTDPTTTTTTDAPATSSPVPDAPATDASTLDATDALASHAPATVAPAGGGCPCSCHGDGYEAHYSIQDGGDNSCQEDSPEEKGFGYMSNCCMPGLIEGGPTGSDYEHCCPEGAPATAALATDAPRTGSVCRDGNWMRDCDDFCSDGIDNDGDGILDCDDWKCSESPDVTVCGAGTPAVTAAPR